MALSTFMPNEVTISMVGDGWSHVVSGFAEDSIVTIDRQAETFAMYVGADNTPTRIYNANTALMMTVALAQTSESNDLFSAVYEKDRTTRQGVFTVLVTDNSGRSRYFAEEAYIGVVPNASYGNSMQTREWVIHAPASDVNLGGNSKISAGTLAALAALGVTVAPQWQ